MTALERRQEKEDILQKHRGRKRTLATILSKIPRKRLSSRADRIRNSIRKKEAVALAEFDTPGIIGDTFRRQDEKDYLTPKPLDLESAIHTNTEQYLAGNIRAKELIRATLTDSKRTYKTHEVELFSNITDLLKTTYVKIKDGKLTDIPGTMTLPGHYTIEHSLHAAQLLADRHEAKVSTIIATLLHDWIEDAGMEIYRERARADLIAERKDFGEKEIEQEIINISSKELYRKLRVKESEELDEEMVKELNKNLLIGIEASAIMTTRAYLNYPKYARDMRDDRRLRKNDSELGEEITAHGISQNEIIEAAMLAKLADKETGILTWDEFSSVKKIKTLGKVELVLNPAREFMNTCPKMYRENVKLMQQQLLLSTKYKCEEEIENAQQLLRLVDGVNQPYRTRDSVRNRWIAEVNEGLFFELNSADEVQKVVNPSYRGSMHEVILMGTKPEDKFKNLPEYLQLSTEDADEFRIRLIEDKANAENELISCINYTLPEEEQKDISIKEYLGINFNPGTPETAMETVSNTYLHTNLDKEKKDQTAFGIINYMDTLRAMAGNATHFKYDSTMYFNLVTGETGRVEVRK